MTEPAKATILAVDDDIINIKVLARLLGDEYAVLSATSGVTALEIAAGALPDLILLDIGMPEMDGFQVCRALKADPLLKDVPVIFLTGMTEEEDETVGFELGAVDYITKPFKPTVVKLRIRTHLELKRQRDLLNRLSMVDGLTGIPNRRSLDERLTLEWGRALRLNEPLSFVLADVDCFKAFNDVYGHLAGDDCLRQVARVLEKTLSRTTDFVGRYGGEEFGGVISVGSAQGLFAVAEKMRSSVADLRIPHCASPAAPFVTISLGAALCVPQKGMAPESLIEMADRHLYLAKSRGRNQVSAPEGCRNRSE